MLLVFLQLSRLVAHNLQAYVLPFQPLSPFHGSFFYLVNRFLSFSPAVSFIASSFSSSFVSIRRVHLAGSLTIRAFQGSADSSIGSRTKLQGTSSSRSFSLCRCPSPLMRTRWTILGEFQPPDVFPLARYILFFFLFYFFFVLVFVFFPPFSRKLNAPRWKTESIQRVKTTQKCQVTRVPANKVALVPVK